MPRNWSRDKNRAGEAAQQANCCLLDFRHGPCLAKGLISTRSLLRTKRKTRWHEAAGPVKCNWSRHTSCRPEFLAKDPHVWLTVCLLMAILERQFHRRGRNLFTSVIKSMKCVKRRVLYEESPTSASVCFSKRLLQL